MTTLGALSAGDAVNIEIDVLAHETTLWRVVAEEEVVASTRKGKQILNITEPEEARVCVPADGNTVAFTGSSGQVYAAAGSTAAKFASSSAMFADFPPSSRKTFFTVSAAAAASVTGLMASRFMGGQDNDSS